MLMSRARRLRPAWSAASSEWMRNAPYVPRDTRRIASMCAVNSTLARPRRQRSLPPRVVPAEGDTQHAAHGGDRMDIPDSMLVDIGGKTKLSL